MGLDNTKIPMIDITKMRLKCGSIVVNTIQQKDNVHTVVVSHSCDGDYNHGEEHCVCKCGFYWQKQQKDSIGE